MNGKRKSSSRQLSVEVSGLKKAIRSNLEGLGYGG